MAQSMGQGGQHDEEREQRDQREISEISGMDEPVRIHTHGDALDDIERPRVTAVRILMVPAPLGRFG